jgi:arylsulfatase A-like enzyme
VSLINPHDIPFGSLYFDRNIPDYPITLPKSWDEDLTSPGLPPELRRAAPAKRNRKQFPGAFDAANATKEEWVDYLRRYYYLLQDCDHNVGIVLDALEAAGGRDNTIVFYTADHGEMGSAHGRVQKGVMYEEAVTVPLIISNPVKYRTPETTDMLASNIDLATTMAGSAGIKWPRPLHGIDLLKDKRDAVFSVAGVSTDLKGLVKMVRDKDWKLVVYPSGAMQLFDMHNDIDELDNRVNDPSLQSVVRGLKARMDKEIA